MMAPSKIIVPIGIHDAMTTKRHVMDLAIPIGSILCPPGTFVVALVRKEKIRAFSSIEAHN